MDALSENEKATATSLVEMGLPEDRAILRARDLAKGQTTPSASAWGAKKLAINAII